MALTAKQKAFAENYALHGNARKCYLDAYPDCNSVQSADTHAGELLKKPEVVELIQAIRKEALARLGDKFDYIAQQLVDDIEWRGDKGQKSTTWAKSMQMLQSMYGFQQMKLDVETKNEVVINIKNEDKP